LFFGHFSGAARALGGASHAAEEPGRAHGTAPGAADARWTDGHGAMAGPRDPAGPPARSPQKVREMASDYGKMMENAGKMLLIYVDLMIFGVI